MADRAPGRFEFQFLKFLSENPGLTSRQIYEQFGSQHGYVRGTVVKAIDRLHRKGQIARELKEGIYVYSAQPDATSSDHELIASFVRDRLEGRTAPLVAFFADSDHLDNEDIQELKSLIQRLEAENR